MRFEADTPAWVKEEFQKLLVEAGSHDSKQVEILRVILSADGNYRGPIWKGLEKRQLRHGLASGKLRVLARSVWRGIQSRHGDALISAKEKEALALRLARAAREFSLAWRAVSGADEASAMPQEIATELEIEYAKWISSTEPYASRYVDTMGMDSIEKRIPYELLRNLDSYADAVAVGAERWKQAEVPLAKPNHPNADRLWFIRRVTESLHHYFGAPMREEVLALTNIWFGETGLSVNALSELAKVSELPRSWPPHPGQIPTRRD